MAGLGLQGAYGLAGAQQSLDQLLAQRAQAAELQRRAALEARTAQRADETADLQRDRFAFEQEQALTPKPQGPISMSPGGALVDPSTGRIITQVPDRPEKPQGPVSLSPGGSLVDPGTGRIITSIPDRPREDTFGNWKRQYDYELANPKKSADDGRQSPFQTERQARTLQSVDELLGKVSRKTVGFGSLLSAVPESDARNFSAEVETLKSAIIQGELTAMREASKTGGALGQVSDREANFLAASLGALDVGQSPENMKAQLQKIKASIERWQAAQGLASPGRTGAPSPGAGGGLKILSIEEVQ